jgi:hypothetical protein
MSIADIEAQEQQEEKMEGIIPYLIWASLIVTGLSLALMLGFGVRNLVRGKADPVTVGVLALPAVAVGILSFVTDSWGEAFILGVIGLLVITALSLLISSFRMMFGL